MILRTLPSFSKFLYIAKRRLSWLMRAPPRVLKTRMGGMERFWIAPCATALSVSCSECPSLKVLLMLCCEKRTCDGLTKHLASSCCEAGPELLLVSGAGCGIRLASGLPGLSLVRIDLKVRARFAFEMER